MSQLAKIIYVVLIAIISIMPFYITERILFIPESHFESLAILIVLLLIYAVHSYDVKRKEMESKYLRNKLDDSISHVNESLQYIGTLNRRLSFLKELTTNPLRNTDDKKAIFEELLSIAVESIAKADWGMFRFVDKKTGNTIKEFYYTSKKYLLLKTQISNKELVWMVKNKIKIKQIGELDAINASDDKLATQCFLIIPAGKKKTIDEQEVLRSITDQAQLFYKYLF